MGEVCDRLHDPNEVERIVGEAISTVLTTVDLATVLERTGRLLRRNFGQTRVTINRCLDAEPGTAEVVMVDDPRFGAPELGSRFPLAGSAAGQAVAERKPFAIDPIRPDAPTWREENLLGPFGYGSLVSFPLIFEEQVLGTLDIAHMPEEGLLACCFKTAQQVARLTAIALHNSLMVEEIKRLNRLLDKENAQLREEIRQVSRESRYLAESPAMKQVVERVKLVAPSQSTVLLLGETGTGKEGLARMVHQFSPRLGKPFVVVNLGAIPDTLIESELFGHEKGAFTGALRRKAGRFEQADGGTIFLDEIGDAPPSVQVRLLRVLQEREIQRVGGTEPVKVDVRVVAATHRDLAQMVSQGSFRSDLFYRLNVFPVAVPPLRARREDIRPLATYFLARQAAAMNRRPPAVSENIFRTLESYDWPGNVRELDNFIQRSLILSPGGQLHALELGSASPPAPLPEATRPGQFEDEVRTVIERALTACQGKVYGPDGAAALLGLKPTTLQGKMRKYRILPSGAR